MILDLINLKNYIPYKSVDRVQDINFKELFDLGKRVVLTDLDNTLVSYAHSVPNTEMIEFVKHLQDIGYVIVIISNSPYIRVNKFLKELNLPGVGMAKKPLKSGMNKAIKGINYSKEQMVFLGDQLMTDVLVGNRMKIDTYLVNPIESKSEKWYTKINRRIEKSVVKRIKKKYYTEYLEKLGERYGL